MQLNDSKYCYVSQTIMVNIIYIRLNDQSSIFY